ncbi:NAD-dependent epimerase/dehydratase family protein [Pseudodesulfovibrio karagichevae]|uniref:NAD-dependent epimerase/dehydratase family protein n=1 Tax=Pseudodesulfovibrio karagichevae TaxID=3239305 RepID=A0ABV4K4M0_9BACT
MKILLAGGAGYIGCVLAPMLRDRGYDVTVCDSLWFGNHLPEDIEVMKSELFDLQEEDLRGYDQVVFLGGLSNDPMAEFSPALNFKLNCALPCYLAYIAKRAGVKRYIYASSCSVYGYTVDELYDEDDPVTCGYPYGISKLQGERGALQLVDDDFSVICLRQGTVCGYSPRMRFDLIINTMFKAAYTTGQVTVNNPSIWRPILDVRDTSSAFLRAVQANESISGVFNVASGNFTVGQVGDIVAESVQNLMGEKVKLNIGNMRDFRNYKVSCERAKTVLGFMPKYGIEDILQSIFDHIDEYTDFEADRYYNIKVFKKMENFA